MTYFSPPLFFFVISDYIIVFFDYFVKLSL
nr:MAG TPA: hypothetical protein [Caudoviricetes sp.]